VTIRQLRARLERLAPAAGAILPEDRDACRRRREELRYRKFQPAGITEPERQELAKLDAFFADEDRDRDRLLGLAMDEFEAWRRGEQLPEFERAELAMLQEKYPLRPDPLDPFLDAMEEALRKWG
jgi:hypothetical protein